MRDSRRTIKDQLKRRVVSLMPLYNKGIQNVDNLKACSKHCCGNPRKKTKFSKSQLTMAERRFKEHCDSYD